MTELEQIEERMTSLKTSIVDAVRLSREVKFEGSDELIAGLCEQYHICYEEKKRLKEDFSDNCLRASIFGMNTHQELEDLFTSFKP